MTTDQSTAATAERPRNPRRLRIGDRIRSTVDDVNQTVGLEGLVINITQPLFRQPLRANVLWDNDTVSMAADSTFEWLPRQA